MAHSLLIKTITNMVLISIQPFAFRKILLVLVAIVGFSALCFADPVLMAEHYVPGAGLFEATTNPGIPPQGNSVDPFRRVDQAQFDALHPVDLPSRDQRLLPKWESKSETLGRDDRGDIFQQTV
jgi:hypothetical protein